MFKKTLLSIASAAALLGAVAAPAFASSKFFLVVPLSTQAQTQDPVEAITVSLAGAALPKATVNKSYSESLRPYLSVTGDAAFDPAAASWSLAEGALPAGLALDETTGAVAGTPTAKTTSPASFAVLATYKGKGGQAVYTIEVGGQVLTVSHIAAGSQHTCAITELGGVKCWGRNAAGQLGDNSTTDSQAPVDVVGLSSGVTSVMAGSLHTCALTKLGAVKCWGNNSSGQLGDNSTTRRISPVDVVGLGSGIASIAANGAHSCAVTTLGAAKCWGYNHYGQLGDNSTTQRNAPVDVAGIGAGVAIIAAGANHTCAVTTSGAGKCWGYNYYGQLGDNSTAQRTLPVDVAGLSSGVVRISAGYYHTCAVALGGAAKCWGYNYSGQLGDNSTTDRILPMDVVGLTSGVMSISGGGNHTCAVMSSGAAKCWGYNGSGQLGDNSTTERKLPVAVAGLEGAVIGIALGGNHTCAMLNSGAAKCWGTNANGQLGDNSTTNRLTPVDVQGFQ